MSKMVQILFRALGSGWNSGRSIERQNVRPGSEADITGRVFYVRYVPTPKVL